MAQPGQTTIQLYSTTTTATTPSPSNLVSGELALNLTDKKVFSKDGSGNVVEMTLSPLNPTYTGTLTGGTGVVNLGSGQFVKDASGNVSVSGNLSTPSWQTLTNGTRVAVSTSSAYTRFTNAGNNFYIGTDNSSGSGFSAGGSPYAANYYIDGNYPHIWSITGAEVARLAVGGNFGLGVTPSAWSGFTAFQLPNGAVFSDSSSLRHINNGFFNGTNWIYSATGYASRCDAKSGGHYWYTAPSGTAGNPISFTQTMTLDASGNLTPGGDNTQTNGSGAKRWSVIYAGTGTINTSDAREKTDVRVMAADEIEAAKALSKEIGVYQFLASVEAKGDKARHHIGMTVQRAIEIMKHHGLDPFSYGFICYDKWGEETKEHPAVEAREAVEAVPAVMDDDGNVIEPAVEAQPAIEAKEAWTEVTLQAGDRYSFRYDQLTLFIARGIDARLAALEAAA